MSFEQDLVHEKSTYIQTYTGTHTHTHTHTHTSLLLFSC